MGLPYSALLRGAGWSALHNPKYPQLATQEHEHLAQLPKHVAAFAGLGSEMGVALSVVMGLALGLVGERFLEFRQKVWLIANISVVRQ
jgi:hypothetical protein